MRSDVARLLNFSGCGFLCFAGIDPFYGNDPSHEHADLAQGVATDRNIYACVCSFDRAIRMLSDFLVRDGTGRMEHPFRLFIADPCRTFLCVSLFYRALFSSDIQVIAYTESVAERFDPICAAARGDLNETVQYGRFTETRNHQFV